MELFLFGLLLGLMVGFAAGIAAIIFIEEEL